MPPPSNDNFADAETIVFGSTVNASNVDATKEVGEPDHAGVTSDASIWWKFTAAGQSEVFITTEGTPVVDTVLAVYTGSSVDALTEVVSNDDAGPGGISEVTFFADNGVTYHVAVDTYGIGDHGDITFRAESTPMLQIFDSGLDTNNFPLTQECVVNVGGGRFVIICNLYVDNAIGFVVANVSPEGEVTFGTPGSFSSANTGSNPTAYWDTGESKLVVFYDDYPCGKYILSTVSGLTVTEVARGALSAAEDFIYAVIYDETSSSAIVAYKLDRASSVIGFSSLVLAGTSFAEYPASLEITGSPYGGIVKLATCGTYAIVSLTYPTNPEVRILSNLGSPSFAASSGYAIPTSGYIANLGIIGSDDGRFTSYWGDGSDATPYLIPGSINAGVPSFGLSPLEYVTDVDAFAGNYYGEYIGSGCSAGEGRGVFAIRINGDSIHMFSTTNEEFEVSVTSSLSSAPGLQLETVTYDHVPVAFDFNVGYALCAFFVKTGSSTGDIKVAVLPVSVPAPIFWKNNTLQVEVPVSGVEKQATKKIIAGLLGQAYVPPTPAIPARIDTIHGIGSSCKRVVGGRRDVRNRYF